jgi:flagellar biosynthetic protein FlhB
VQIEDFLSISSLPISVAIPKAFHLLAWSFLIVSCSLILIAVIDVPFQLFDHSQQLKMTKQEVRDEYKETEGKPEVKSRIRRMQQEMAQNRMMAEVPKADVILTNPTHFAVALVYEQDGLTAPRVIAKGQDHMAIQIGKIAKAHEVPILRLPPLTRAIYYSTEIDQEIPRGLYIAVAQVLAYIFQLKTKDRLDDIEATPDALNDLPIPDDLKRDPKES